MVNMESKIAELKSPTKFKVLRAIEESGGLEAVGLSIKLGIVVSHASKLLRTYWMKGLLIKEKRSMSQGGVRFFYTLSKSGKKRLDYFKRLLLVTHPEPMGGISKRTV